MNVVFCLLLENKSYVHEEIIFVSTWLFLASHSSRYFLYFVTAFVACLQKQNFAPIAPPTAFRAKVSVLHIE